jgi:hypothetical protein
MVDKPVAVKVVLVVGFRLGQPGLRRDSSRRHFHGVL